MQVSTIYAAESGHWYAPDGSPAYEVPCKSRPGEMRPTTLRDARALNLVPSVTGILKVAARPGLEIWKAQQILHAALTLPRIDGETENDYAERVIADSKEQTRKAAERGTAIHASVERMLGGDAFDPAHERHVCNLLGELRRLGLDTASRHTERTFASPLGFGGKVDLHGTAKNGTDFVFDFKSKEDFEDDAKLVYPEHGMQLVAYGKGLGLTSPRLFSGFIAANSAKVHVHEWPAAEHERLWGMFSALLTYWKLSNRIL